MSAWPGGSWSRHTIDDSSFGADGVRLADANGDGLVDVVSPWEQGGRVRVYLNPGRARSRERWPAVTVGEVGDPEDAFFVDLDGDGAIDVVSSCEGQTRSIFVHWGPEDSGRILDPSAWSTAELPAAAGVAQWMYAYAMQVDGKHAVDIVAGAKGDRAQLGWFESPEDPRDLAAWTWHPLYDAGWIMTLRPRDMDLDGDQDIVATDRRGRRSGAFWLEHPGARRADGPWVEHRIGPMGEHEAMHNAVADLDGDGMEEVLVAVKDGPIRMHRRSGGEAADWQTHLVAMPPHTGSGKSVEVADVNLDGAPDLVVACEHATAGKIGLFWLEYGSVLTGSQWEPHSVSGPEGFIYDLIQLRDLDADGDLDVLTLEEKGPYLAEGYEGSELGVIWYENPER